MTSEQAQALATVTEMVTTAAGLMALARQTVYSVNMVGTTTPQARLAITAAHDNLVIAARELAKSDAPLTVAAIDEDGDE